MNIEKYSYRSASHLKEIEQDLCSWTERLTIINANRNSPMIRDSLFEAPFS